MRKTKNSSLKNVVDQLYRPGAFIGDGGTASVVLFEKKNRFKSWEKLWDSCKKS